MLRRLHHDQPESFAFTPANKKWAKAQVTKYPKGRQASAIIPLLWRAQEQEGWLSRPAIEHVADMLGMPYIRALEVASFYFMFQLQPVGSVAHIQVCGTTSCMICGAEDLIGVCREKIAPTPHTLSEDGKFSWEEVECLGACANAPMAQIGKDYYEDLTADKFAQLLDDLAAGNVPVPGPQNGRFAAEPASGLTSLKEFESGHARYNASAQRAVDLGETIKRIDGSEVPLLTPWIDKGAMHKPAAMSGARPNGKATGTAGGKAPAASKAEASKAVTAKADASKAEAATAKADATKAETTRAATAKADTAKSGAAKTAAPKAESPKSGATKAETAKAETAKAGAAKAGASKSAPAARAAGDVAQPANAKAAGSGTPKASTSKTNAPKTNTTKAGQGAATVPKQQRPKALKQARKSGPDDLKLIKGVGPKLETLLHSLGFFHFDQVAAWTDAEIAWVDNNLEGFKGRVSRDDWVAQARILAAGGDTGFSKKNKL